MKNYSLGIDIGGTFIKYALVDGKLKLLNLKQKMNFMIIYVQI